MRAWLWIALAAVVLAFIGVSVFTLQQSAMVSPDFVPGEAPPVGELPDQISEVPEVADPPETEELAEQEPAAAEPDFPDMAFGDEDFLAEAPAEAAPAEPTFPQTGGPVDPVEEALRDQAWPARAAIEADEHMSYGDRRQARLHIQRGEAAEIDELAPQTVFDRAVDMTSEVQASAEATRHLRVMPKSPEANDPYECAHKLDLGGRGGRGGSRVAYLHPPAEGHCRRPRADCRRQRVPAHNRHHDRPHCQSLANRIRCH
jgi:hypothetical protein